MSISACMEQESKMFRTKEIKVKLNFFHNICENYREDLNDISQ